MGYIVLALIILAICIGGYLFAHFVFDEKEHPKNIGFVIFSAAIGAELFIAILSSITIISTGNIGVVRTFGQVNTQDLLKEGMHFVLPWQNVFTMDNRTTKTTLDKPAEAASHDMQSVHTNIAVNWRVSPDKVGTVLQQFGIAGDGGGEALVDKIVVPSILETFKSVISQYTAEELVTKRVEVSNRVTEYLTKKLAQYDLVVEATNLTDFQFSQQFNAAIEAKVTATQQALQAEQILKRVKIEAEQRVAQAQGEAEAIKIQASAIQAQGGAAYVQLQAVHKWNGVLPTMMLSEKSIPFIAVNK